MSEIEVPFAVETANAPGAATSVILAGAVAGRPPLGLVLTSGAQFSYVMDDDTQQEEGIGTYTSGSPSSFTRDAVKWNSSTGYASPAKLNFTGQTFVYTGIPSVNKIYIDSAGVVNFKGSTAKLGFGGNAVVNARQIAAGTINGLITTRASVTSLTTTGGIATDEISGAGYIESAVGVTISGGSTGANGLDTGTIANNKWYAVFIIGKPDGTVAGLLSLSLTPTLPSGYTMRRRIGLVLTDASAHFVPYAQAGSFFQLTPMVSIYASNVGTSNVLIPAIAYNMGLSLRASIRAQALSTGLGAWGFNIGSGFTTQSGAPYSLVGPDSQSSSGQFQIQTDNNGQISLSASVATVTPTIYLEGWSDDRGRGG